jgi:hypothetical protein
MTREKLAAHVHQLAEQHGVEVVYQGRGIGYRRERRITIPDVRGRVTYLTALHELAHVVGPNPDRRLEQEIAAWKWALDNSVIEPTPATYRSILRCLENYRSRAERWASMVIPGGYDEYLEELRELSR